MDQLKLRTSNDQVVRWVDEVTHKSTPLFTFNYTNLRWPIHFIMQPIGSDQAVVHAQLPPHLTHVSILDSGDG
jgi:hypothetical protein